MKRFGLINMGVLPLLLEAMTPVYAQHDGREQEARRPQQEHAARPEQRQQEGRPGRQEQPQRPQEARPPRQEQSQRQQEARPERPSPQGRPARQEEPQRPRGRQERPQQEGRGQQEQRPQQPKDLQHLRGQPAPQEQQRQQQARGHQEQPRATRPAPQAPRQYASQHGAAWPERRARNFQSEHRTWQDRGGYSGFRIPSTRYRSSFGPSHGFRMFSYPLVVVGGFPRFEYGGLWFSVMDPWPEYWSNNWYDDDDMYIEYWGGGYYLQNRRHPMDRISVTVLVR